MIVPRQLKAARALLGWRQADLAAASGLHLNAINKIEKEQVAPRQESMARLQSCLERQGIRFRGVRGVELKEDTFELARFEGADCVRRLTDDILASVAAPQDEILNCLADEYLFEAFDSKQAARYAAHLKKTGVGERYVTDSKQTRFRRADKKIYRGVPRRALGTVSYIVYGGRVAFINWPQREILVIKNASLAATYRAQFAFLWDQAKPFDSSVH